MPGGFLGDMFADQTFGHASASCSTRLVGGHGGVAGGKILADDVGAGGRSLRKRLIRRGPMMVRKPS